MTITVLACTDGSDLSEAAIADGLGVVRTPDRLVVATAVDPVDASLAMGTGFAGGVMSAEEVQREYDERVAAAESMLTEVCARLGLENAERVVVSGPAASALVELAESLPASVIVIGTRGRGGLRRAVLGSVSDHVVRHAPCPVVTRTPHHDESES